MMPKSSLFRPGLFSQWALRRRERARCRDRAIRSRRGGTGSWERLGLCLADAEQLEQRALMAADLVLSLHDNVAANVDSTFYSPASQIAYTLTVENKGDAEAANVTLSTSLASAITQKVWMATYTGVPRDKVGDTLGQGDVNIPVTLPAGAKVTVSIFGTVGAAATGNLVSSAAVTKAAGETNTANNSMTDTDTFVPNAVVVSGDAGGPQVRLVDPATGRVIAEASPFRPDLRTGVRTSFADLDGDGKKEVIAVTNYGTAAELAVLKQSVTTNGSGTNVTLVKDTRYSLQPFGGSYTRGLNVTAADFNGDGFVDVAVSKAFGDGAVKIYASTPKAASGPLTLTSAFTPFPGALGGATLTGGDMGTFSGGAVVNGAVQDGKAELVVASGADAAPVVRVYDVRQSTPVVLDSFQPFSSDFRGGLHVDLARVNADAIPDIIVSQGRGGNSLVEVYNGRVGLLSNPRLARFAAFSDAATRGAAVFATAVDSNGDGLADGFVATQGGAGRSALRRFSTSGALLEAVPAIAGSNQVSGMGAGARLAFLSRPTITTASGLQFQELVAGTGASPRLSSTVDVDYTGILQATGRKFDSNAGASFRVTGVVPGFKEALQKMKPGSIVRVVIPPSIGYGSTGSTPQPDGSQSVPPNATMIFYIKLNSFTG